MNALALTLAVALPTGVSTGIAWVTVQTRRARAAARLRQRLWDVGVEIQRERDAALAALVELAAAARADRAGGAR